MCQHTVVTFSQSYIHWHHSADILFSFVWTCCLFASFYLHNLIAKLSFTLNHCCISYLFWCTNTIKIVILCFYSGLLCGPVFQLIKLESSSTLSVAPIHRTEKVSSPKLLEKKHFGETKKNSFFITIQWFNNNLARFSFYLGRESTNQSVAVDNVK